MNEIIENAGEQPSNWEVVWFVQEEQLDSEPLPKKELEKLQDCDIVLYSIRPKRRRSRRRTNATKTQTSKTQRTAKKKGRQSSKSKRKEKEAHTSTMNTTTDLNNIDTSGVNALQLTNYENLLYKQKLYKEYQKHMKGLYVKH